MDVFHRQMMDRTYREMLQVLEYPLSTLKKKDKTAFLERFETHFEALAIPVSNLYKSQIDFYKHFEALCLALLDAWKQRPEYLKKLDEERIQNPNWFQSNQMMGAVCYVDLFNQTLKGVEEKIPYFKSLGITYLHLMPLFKAPEAESDGGYAVSSYREVNPQLGNMDDLARLSKKLKKEGISLVLDFINNHTSDEHAWAKAAKAGDPTYRDYYFIFPDRTIPDQFEHHLREIFPEIRQGNFTWVEEVNGWVWTTFHNYQWDLNYRNPAVFTAMAKEMLFLANMGVDFLRLDAVPFVWKRMGTNCENLPEVHEIIKALNACARIATPGLLFKSEAIVHPDDVSSYIHSQKCQVSYNPTVMALLWESLATRKKALLQESLKHRFAIHSETAWVNYVRSHDDIGWTFSDDDASNVGIHASGHRHFLNQFYSSDFIGGFAKGQRFQYNPNNGDMRICGTTASLAGLEAAIERNDPGYISDAIKRITLLYGMTMSLGGIPLLYLGDEIGTLNDYSYQQIKGKKHDSRWLHRTAHDWSRTERAQQGKGVEAELFHQLKHLIHIRKQTPAFAAGNIHLVETASASVLAFLRMEANERVLVLANFSEQESGIHLPETWLNKNITELISGHSMKLKDKSTLKGYELCWIAFEQERVNHKPIPS